MDVFFWDSPRLDYEVSHDCDFVISGETFGRSAYSIGLTKGSFWTEHVTMQLLDLTESGYMEVSFIHFIFPSGKRESKATTSSSLSHLPCEITIEFNNRFWTTSGSYKEAKIATPKLKIHPSHHPWAWKRCE